MTRLFRIDRGPLSDEVGNDGDVCVAASGRLWDKVANAWVYRSYLGGDEAPSRVAFTDGEPLFGTGVEGQWSIAGDGRTWQKRGDEWVPGEQLIAPALLASDFSATGKISLPITAGKVRLYDSEGVHIGDIVVSPPA